MRITSIASFFYSFCKLFLKCSVHIRSSLCITFHTIHTLPTHLTLYTLCITFVVYLLNYETRFKKLYDIHSSSDHHYGDLFAHTYKHLIMNFSTEDLQAEMDAIRNNKSERMSEKELNAKTVFEKDESDNGTIWNVLIYLLAALSAVTASFFITHLFNLSGVAGWVFAGIILIGWEWLKNIFTGRSMRLFVGSGKVNPVFAGVAIICVAGSVYSSFEGGRIGNKTINDKSGPIMAKYADDIAQYEAKLQTQYNTTWKGRVTSAAQKQIAILEPALLDIKAKRTAELNSADATLENESTLIGYVTILLEILLLIAHYQNTMRLHEEHLQIKAKRNLQKRVGGIAPVVSVQAPVVSAPVMNQVGYKMGIKDPSGERSITIKARVRDYKGRVEALMAKVEKLQAEGKDVPKKTLAALENNSNHLETYIDEANDRQLTI